MTNYSRGYNFEQKIAADLTQDGYWCMRAGGSHGVADVLALKPGQVVLVQAKIDGAISIADWNGLYSLATRLGAVPLLALRPKRGVIEYRRLTGTREARVPPPYEAWTADLAVRA